MINDITSINCLQECTPFQSRPRRYVVGWDDSTGAALEIMLINFPRSLNHMPSHVPDEFGDMDVQRRDLRMLSSK